MKRFVSLVIFILSLAVSIAGLTAEEVSSRPLSLKSAVKKAKSELDGKVLSTKTKKTKDGWVHKIRILSDEGKIKTLVYPAKRPKE